MDVKKHLIETLDKFGYPVFLQGSLSDDDKYPDSFFTFWNNGTECYYMDNVVKATMWDFDLNFYSSNPETVNMVLLQARKLLKSAGFTVQGKGYDVISDEPTHTGRGINIFYFEKEGA